MADTETVEMPETEKVNPVSGVQADTEQENNAVVEEPNEEVTKEISNVNQDEYEPMDNTQLKAEEMEAQAEITEAQIEEPMVQSEEPVAQSEELVAQSEEPMVQSEETKEPEKEDQVVPEEKVTEEPSPPPELEKYWKVVRDNCSDFTGWTYLLQYVEQENHLESAREAFSAFFDRYPYCYGYWKKLADLEKKHGNLDRACEAFDRGTRAIALSVDLWIHYINFFMDNFANDSDFVERTRSLFDRAVAASGTEFRSDKLWDMYINWEKEKKNLKKMTGLYDKLLGIPTQLYSHHFDQFKEHVNGNMPRDILTTDEFLKMRTEVIASNPIVESDVVDDAPPGVEAPPGMEDPETNASKLDAETVAIRTKIIETRKEVFRVTEEEVSRRWAFEEGIKRPYFHVKPLERAQLKNWREYLDFEIENGSHERVVVLFERCMIACALYEDFWLKYARYMEPHSKEGVSAVFRRACHIHLPKKPNIHLQWAAYEEQQGNIEEAREVFKNLEAVVPGLAMVTLRRINLERRHGDLDTVDKVFKDCLSRSKSKKLASFYAIKYSRFHSKIQNDTEKAKAVLNEALKKDQGNPKLYLQLLDLEFQSNFQNEEAVLALFERILNNKNVSIDSKVLFSQRKLEYLEDFGSDVTKLLAAYEDHQKLIKQHGGKKRPHGGDGDDAVAEKKVKSNGSVGSTGSAQADANSSAYNYNWTGYNSSGAYNYQQPPWNTYGQGYYQS